MVTDTTFVSESERLEGFISDARASVSCLRVKEQGLSIRLAGRQAEIEHLQAAVDAASNVSNSATHILTQPLTDEMSDRIDLEEEACWAQAELGKLQADLRSAEAARQYTGELLASSEQISDVAGDLVDGLCKLRVLAANS